MQKANNTTMRDAFIGRITEVMGVCPDIFFLSADFGAPALDRLRDTYPHRFINVGIAEQNLINIATGLALEGYTVCAYAIAPFITMRCFEQIRVNLSILSHYRPLNVNLVGVGAGASYEMSGPTHHCFEDLSIMRTLPNVDIFSPCDTVLTRAFVDYALQHCRPKYLRLDGKPLGSLYADDENIPWDNGFKKISGGRDVIIISTGYMTHKAVRISEMLCSRGYSVCVIDVFLLRPFNEIKFAEAVKGGKLIITIEEAFIHKGGLDSMVSGVVQKNHLNIPVLAFGYQDAYSAKTANREELARENKMSDEDIIRSVMEECAKQ
jgi:transketolase